MKRIVLCLATLACVTQAEYALSFNVLTPDDFIIAIDTDPATNSGSPASGNESASKAIDNSIDTKYLNFATTRTGFIVTPGTSGAVQSFVITTGNDAAGRDPSSYELWGTNQGITTQDHLNGRDQEWTLISQGALELPGDPALNDFRKQAGPAVGFANGTNYSSYKMIFPTTKTANSIMQFAEIGLYTSMDGSGADLTAPGNTIIPIQDIDHFSRSNYPANESPSKVIDRVRVVPTTNNKYLNFAKENSGFIVTPSGKTIVNGFSITTAGDAAGRDPASYEIWGTNDEISTSDNGLGDKEEYTLIASGTLALPDARNTHSGDISFSNTTRYSSYKVVFPTLRDSATVNSMQIGEFELHAADVSALVINRSGPDVGKGYIRADINLSVGAYEIRSAAGQLNPAGWNSITSSGSDPGDDWQITSSTATLIGESDGSGGANNGFALSAGGQFNLGNAFRAVPTFLADGITPTGWEDAIFLMSDPDGNLIGGKTEFVGDPVPWGDYNADGVVNAGDWPLFRANLGATYTGMTAIDAYLGGDLDGDLDSDLDDFNLFVELAGGMGALFGNPVPEPSSIALVGLAGVMLLGRKRFRGWIAGAATLLLAAMPVASEAADLQFQVVLPNPTVTIPAGQLNENTGTEAVPIYSSPDKLFDDIALNDSGNINTDLFTLNYYTLDLGLGQYAIGGEKPGEQDTAVVFMDYGTPITANWFAYSQRTGGNSVADKVGKFEFWFSNTDFGGTLPATDPNATFQLLSGDSRIDDSIIRPYTLGGEHSGRYVAMRITETVESGALTSTSRIGGHEFRLLEGPSDVVVDVNRATGEITLRNNLPGSAEVFMKGYSIESPSGSLDPEAFDGVRGNGAFSLGNGSGNGWEIGNGSSTTRLVETFFSGQTPLASGASAISLGNAYNEFGTEDLVFKWTNAAGEIYNARVVYNGTAPVLGGDYNNDGIVNLADYTVWRDNLGASITLPGDTTPGSVTAADYTVWKNNFGAGSPGVASGLSTTNVPEPSTLLLIAAAALPLALRRRAS